MDERGLIPWGDVGTTTFAWRPAKGAKGTIEVHTETDVLGTLHREKGRPTIATTADASWTIEKGRGTIVARDDRGFVAATYTADKRGGTGTLRVAGGEEYRWAPTHPRQAERAFYASTGQRIVRFWKDWHFVSVTDKGEADPGMAALPELPLLVMLGRVIGIGQDDDSVMVAVMAATSTL